MKYTTVNDKALPENIVIRSAGHVRPGDTPTRTHNPTWESAREQRGSWGQAPGPFGYYTAWIEYKGEIYFPEGDEHGHKAALLGASFDI